ncbi:cytochrome c maturation protein CcmE [Thiomicrorhabdus cannonii]|uniref:cytochrome c maturation protein CcmE n=1 Tax=Thiomicrorhabdus cannonii TaxID=2748011 RepID=UPI0015BD6FF3|nr:cytochrome c maturation protein CcmE [Thiomicrorhabdus cannonii]
MSPLRKKRLYTLLLLLSGVGLATFLLLQAFSENMMFYFSTSEVQQGKAPQGRDFRLGGLVVNGTVQRDPTSLKVRFDLTDGAANVTVEYNGILPDLFREGQGIIANGRLNAEGIFMAHEVLAKHDENYMPPEVADSLKQAAKNVPQPQQATP